MNPARRFDRSALEPLDVALVGVGEFGASFLYRSGRAARLRVRAAADDKLERVVSAALAAGYAADQIERCETLAQAHRAFAGGRFVAVRDAALLMALPLDAVVEATGNPESAARVAVLAIAHGRHLGMVSKECDCTVGAALQARAARAGVSCSVVDGDQPALLIKLVRWARALGLPVVCAGKASEYDFVFDPGTHQVMAQARSEHQPRLAKLWQVRAADLAGCVDARRALLSSWVHRTTPDLCELALVANATGLMPDVPGLHAPVLRTLELPDALRPRDEGGLLSREGVLDIFNCLRRPDELSFAGGVFVVVRCDDRDAWKLLGAKGIPVSEDTGCALLHNPVHLLGIEAPFSLIESAATGEPVGTFTPRVDLVARTSSALRKGDRLSLGARHAIAGLEPLLLDARPARGDAAVPYYLAADCELAADVPAGQMLLREHLVQPTGSDLWRLRAEQDARWAA